MVEKPQNVNTGAGKTENKGMLGGGGSGGWGLCVRVGGLGGGGGGRLAKLNQATVEVHKSARPTCSQVSVLLPGGGGAVGG